MYYVVRTNTSSYNDILCIFKVDEGQGRSFQQHSYSDYSDLEMEAECHKLVILEFKYLQNKKMVETGSKKY